MATMKKSGSSRKSAAKKAAKRPAAKAKPTPTIDPVVLAAFTASSSGTPPAVDDQFSDFRASVVGASAASIFRLMPIESFARPAKWTPKPTVDTTATDDAQGLIANLGLPVDVAGFEYPRQCRIRRVRVLAPADEGVPPAPGPVIVSRKALGELREAR